MEANMPFYHKLGQIPHKRHTQFRKPDGSLYREQVVGTKGFSGIQSILYHCQQPTQIKHAEALGDAQVKYAEYGALRHRLFRSKDAPEGGDPLTARRVLLGNANVTMAVARPTESMS